MFAVMCAFAGPLLEILGIGSFGFQLFGPSSIGKTIILMVGGSVWGCRVSAGSPLGFLDTWFTSLEGVRRAGRTHNHAFFPIDEPRLAGTDRELGKLVPTFIMRLAEGVEKNLLVPVGGGWGDWLTVYLGASNPSLVEVFAANGMEFDDAYRVRFPDIVADAGCGYGVFENIHGFPDAAAFAKELSRRSRTYFGTASECYLERLSEDRRDRRGWLYSGLQRAMARHQRTAPVGSTADGRITDNFAVPYAAAILAHHYGILPWTEEEIAWAVQSCERAHHQAVAENRVRLDPIAAVRAYITANLSRFRDVPDPSITDREFSNSLGFLYVNDNDSLEYAVPNKSFARAVGPLNVGDVLRAMDTAGLLVRGRDRYVSKVPIRNSTDDGRKFVYRIRSAILDVPTN
jgi:hypothetical protein